MSRFFSSLIKGNRIYHCIAILIVSLNFVFRLLFVDVELLNNDEAISAVAGVEIAHGGLAYKDAVDHRGPVTYYLYAFAFKICGDYNMLAVRTLLSILIAVSAWLMFKTAELVDSKAAVLVCFAFCLMTIYGSTGDFLAFHTEWPMCFFVTLAGYFLMKLMFQKGSPLGNSVWIGVSFAFAALSKQVAVFDMAALGLVYFVYSIYTKTMNLFWKNVVRMGLAFLVALSAVLGYFWVNNALGDFIFYVYTYNKDFYMQGKSFGTLPNDMINQFLWFFQSRKYVLLLLLPSLLAVFFNKERLKGIQISAILLLSLLGFVIAMIGTCLSGRPFGHYLIQLLPYFSFFLGFALYAFCLWIKRFELVVLCLVLASFGFYFQFYKIHASCIQAIENYQREPIFSFINGNKHPEDKLFVWGFNAEPYVYTRMRPATRYSFCNFQTGLLPFVNKDPWIDTRATIVPHSREELISDLIKNKPAFIIDSSPANYYFYGKYPLATFPELEAFIKKNYDRVALENSKTYPAHLYCRKI